MSLREGRWALAVGLAAHLVFLVSLRTQTLNPLFIEAQRSYGQAADYFGIYQAGENLLAGNSIYDSEDYRNEADRSVPYFYFYRYLPPTAYVSALGTLVLPPWAAYWSWVAINEALLLLVAIWILRLGAYPAALRRLHAGLWIGFSPFYLEQWMGQFSFLMAVFLWILFRSGMPEVTGGGPARSPGGGALRAWIASVALKSFPALFAIPYLLRGWVRPVFVCAGAVLLIRAPDYIARPEDLRQFLALNLHALPPGVHGGTLGASAFVRSLGWMLPGPISGKLLDFGLFDLYAGNLPVFLFSAAVAAAAFWTAFRHGRSPIALHLALWTVAFFLIFKDIWEYHYVMLLPVVTCLGLATRSRLLLWIGLLLALPTPYALLQQDGTLSPAAALAHHASKALPTLVLFLWLLRRIARRSLIGSAVPGGAG